MTSSRSFAAGLRSSAAVAWADMSSKSWPVWGPAVVASLEAAEVCKILLGVGIALRGRWLVINLFDMTFDEIAIPR